MHQRDLPCLDGKLERFCHKKVEKAVANSKSSQTDYRPLVELLASHAAVNSLVVVNPWVDYGSVEVIFMKGEKYIERMVELQIFYYIT